MRYSEVLSISSHGILVHRSSMSPIGIYDGSVGHAVWYERPFPDADTRSGVRPEPRRVGADLIVSPFHPSSWPFLVRMRLNLHDEPGALAGAAEWLSQHRFSILHSTCNPVGFRHAVWDVIAEYVGASTGPDADALRALREKKERFDRRYPFARTAAAGQGILDELLDLSTEIATFMFSTVGRLKAELNEVQQSGLAGGTAAIPLYVPRRYRYFDSDRVEAVVEDGIGGGGLVREHVRRPFSVRYLTQIAAFALYGGGVDVPFRLKFDASAAFLQAPDDAPLERMLELKNELPCPSIAVFNARERYLRLRPIRENTLRDALTEIDVDYEFRGTHANTSRDSRGLLAAICRALEAHTNNLLNVSNKWTNYGYSREEGRISFLGDVAPAEYDKLECAITAEASRSAQDVGIRRVSARKYAEWTLFVSMRFGHPRHDNFVELLDRAARSVGFKATIVTSFTEPITEAVRNKMRSSDAMLQILTLRSTDQPESAHFSWLDFELGLALGEEIPTLRLVDETRVPFDSWMQRLLINRDQWAKPFRSDLGDRELEAQFRTAIAELSGRVKPARGGGGRRR